MKRARERKEMHCTAAKTTSAIVIAATSFPLSHQLASILKGFFVKRNYLKWLKMTVGFSGLHLSYEF
jgi:hypothetical protein